MTTPPRVGQILADKWPQERLSQCDLLVKVPPGPLEARQDRNRQQRSANTTLGIVAKVRDSSRFQPLSTRLAKLLTEAGDSPYGFTPKLSRLLARGSGRRAQNQFGLVWIASRKQ